LLTRGPGSGQADLLTAVNRLASKVDKIEQNTAKTYSSSSSANQALQAIERNTASGPTLVPTT